MLSELLVGHGTRGQKRETRQGSGVLGYCIVGIETRMVLEIVVIARAIMSQPARGRGEGAWHGGGRCRIKRTTL